MIRITDMAEIETPQNEIILAAVGKSGLEYQTEIGKENSESIVHMFFENAQECLEKLYKGEEKENLIVLYGDEVNGSVKNTINLTGSIVSSPGEAVSIINDIINIINEPCEVDLDFLDLVSIAGSGKYGRPSDIISCTGYVSDFINTDIATLCKNPGSNGKGVILFVEGNIGISIANDICGHLEPFTDGADIVMSIRYMNEMNEGEAHILAMKF